MGPILRVVAAPVALVAVVALPGCGPGGGESRPGGVELRITRGFGQQIAYATRRDHVRPRETVIGLLRSKRRVEIAPGGGGVKSIEGLGSRRHSGPRGWFYFVNGLEGSAGPGDRRLSPGDVVQWDYRRTDGARTVPAIVGAYPEPLASGTGGKRLPVRIECADDRAPSCREVERRLRSAGVTASLGSFGKPGGEGLLRVIVAPWSLTRRVRAAAGLEAGPQASGVFARFRAGGQRLELLDPSGRPVRTAPPGTGLVAATALEGEQRVWLVTGSDESGVRRAAGALDRATLRDRYAVAVLPDGVVALPVGGAD